MWALLKLPRFGGASMQTITTIGLDIAKSVFQVHGVDAAGQVLIRSQLKRRYVLAFFQKLPPCLVGPSFLWTSDPKERSLRNTSRCRKSTEPSLKLEGRATMGPFK